MKRVFGVDGTARPVVLLELDGEDLAVLRAGEPLRVELASTLSAWKPVLEPGEAWTVDAVLSLAEDARPRVLDPRVRIVSDEFARAIEAGAWVAAPAAEGVVDLSPGAGWGPVAGPDGLPVEVLARVAEGWTTIAATARASIQAFMAAVREVAEQLEAAGVDLADLVPASPDLGWCMCVCPLHRDEGMFCAGEAEVRVTLTPTRSVPEPRVWMCPACAGWWERARPERVVSVDRPEEPTAAGA